MTVTTSFVLDGASQGKNSSSKESPAAKGNDTPPAKEASPETVKTPEPKQTCFPMRAEETNDSVRLKCRELLASALQTGGKLPIDFISYQNMCCC